MARRFKRRRFGKSLQSLRPCGVADFKMKDDVEGFGIVALEAAAAAKPVVATSVGGVPDAVEDGKSGI